MENDYSDLFDLYLSDISDEGAVPSEFILSSKVIFLSNATSIPGKVKDHTLSFNISSSKEETESEVSAKLETLISDVLDFHVSEETMMKAFEDYAHLKQKNMKQYISDLVIRSSGVPEDKARAWLSMQKGN